ncbi:hypothetical protein JCM11641_006636 [Rhodosporidiobolus odoratus]
MPVEKKPRVSSTKGRHIVQVNPLPKGQSCTTCRTRKVRCSGEKPACRACLRTARFEGRDVNLVVCQYDSRASTSQAKRRGKAASTLQHSSTSESLGSGAGDVDVPEAPSFFSAPFDGPYSLLSVSDPYFPAAVPTSALDSAATPPFLPPSAGHSGSQFACTPTPPLSHASSTSPEASAHAYSPPVTADVSPAPAFAYAAPPPGAWSALPHFTAELGRARSSQGSTQPFGTCSSASLDPTPHSVDTVGPGCRAPSANSQAYSVGPLQMPLLDACEYPTYPSYVPTLPKAPSAPPPSLDFPLPPHFYSSYRPHPQQSAPVPQIASLYASSPALHPRLPQSYSHAFPADFPLSCPTSASAGDGLFANPASLSLYPTMPSPGLGMYQQPPRETMTPGHEHVDNWLRGLAGP